MYRPSRDPFTFGCVYSFVRGWFSRFELANVTNVIKCRLDLCGSSIVHCISRTTLNIKRWTVFLLTIPSFFFYCLYFFFRNDFITWSVINCVYLSFFFILLLFFSFFSYFTFFLDRQETIQSLFEQRRFKAPSFRRIAIQWELRWMCFVRRVHQFNEWE